MNTDLMAIPVQTVETEVQEPLGSIDQATLILDQIEDELGGAFAVLGKSILWYDPEGGCWDFLNIKKDHPYLNAVFGISNEPLKKADVEALEIALLKRKRTFPPFGSNQNRIVPFSNGVFDLDRGVFRDYEPEDWILADRMPTVFYDSQFDDSEPTEVLGLISLMAGGNQNLIDLILAVSYLNIVGVSELPTFKSCFFVWSSPNGYSGRSSLFRVIHKASGGAIRYFDSLEDLKNGNKLKHLIGATGIYIDERNALSKASGSHISALKSIVGGETEVTVKILYKDVFNLKGHWTVNQSTNSLEILYGADQPLQDRSVAIPTKRIPNEAIKAFAADPVRQNQLFSDAEATSLLNFLHKRFDGDPAKAAKSIEDLKENFSDERDLLVSSENPVSEFCERFLEESPGLGVAADKLQYQFNNWLRIAYPRSKPQSVRQLVATLKGRGYTFIRQRSRQFMANHKISDTLRETLNDIIRS